MDKTPLQNSPGRPKGIPNPNGGRKSIYQERMSQKSISLPDHMITFFQELGKGNISEGIRNLYYTFKESSQRE